MKLFKEYIALYLILALYSICCKDENKYDYEMDGHISSSTIDIPDIYLN